MIKTDNLNNSQPKLIDCSNRGGRANECSNAINYLKVICPKSTENDAEVKIDLSKTAMNCSDISDLFKFLCSHTSSWLMLYSHGQYNYHINLTKLDLSNNAIGNDGAELISSFISKGDLANLKELVLSNNSIGYEGITYLMKALEMPRAQGIAVTLESCETFKESCDYTIKTLKHCLDEYQKINTGTNWDSELVKTDEVTRSCFDKKPVDKTKVEKGFFTGLFKCALVGLYDTNDSLGIFICANSPDVFSAISNNDSVVNIGEIGKFMEPDTQYNYCTIL